MWLVWTIAWTIFAANPMALYAAERQIERSAAGRADLDSRLVASAAATRSALRAL